MGLFLKYKKKYAITFEYMISHLSWAGEKVEKSAQSLAYIPIKYT